MPATIEEIRSVLNEVRPQLMNKANVMATGIGYKRVDNRTTDKLAIICSVAIKTSVEKLDAEDLIPQEVQSVPTDVNPTGMFRTLQDPKARFRPAPGGVSIGHVNISAGTLGCLVEKNGELFILSNNHVLANSNEADLEDPILQPGPFDGGLKAEDEIARLSEYVPITYNDGDDNSDHPGNFVDCAIAKPNNTDDIENEIYQVGSIAGVKEAEFDMEVKKSGRTTGLTTGVIEQVDVTSRVNFGSNKVAIFTDQVMAGDMSQGGDSGSAVLDNDDNIVGLLFAGSDTSTLINRIENVFDALEVSLPDSMV
ncbi:hypothetical protein SAMN05443144_101327 [Fodinibius roseus]|uniref:Trypsin-like peptidase domain-containing protein n=1 Tax=Fodinibius roseus TaxID=1194090 RepID=A0A1M4TLQ1_9BACT|nr:hypothetical protein [Fodinibius roseus]SHE45390.1 hypothetical protein SAMN05443144_101327 [Fodinibius roseus]